jgi:hypothetical protein
MSAECKISVLHRLYRKPSSRMSKWDLNLKLTFEFSRKRTESNIDSEGVSGDQQKRNMLVS